MWISLRSGCKRHNGAGRFRHCGAGAPQQLHAKSNPEPVTDNAPDLQLAALNNLGLMYANGQGVPQDRPDFKAEQRRLALKLAKRRQFSSPLITT